LSSRAVILNQQYAHANPLSRRSGSREFIRDKLIENASRAWLTNYEKQVCNRLRRSSIKLAFTQSSNSTPP
jgi:hypothetical protein